MNSKPPTTGASQFRKPMSMSAPRACFALSAIAGALVIAGWELDLPALKTVLPGFISMKANTAIGLVLLSLAGLLSTGKKPGRSRLAARNFLAFLVLALGAATLAEYLFGLNLRIDEFFFADPEALGNRWPPGRFAPITGVNFILLSLALILDQPKIVTGVKFRQALILIAWVISFQALVGYLSGVSYNFGSAFYTQIALHTAGLFVLIASGMLLGRAQDGLMEIALSPGIAGRICRRLLAAGILIPPITNYVALQGARAGLYDADFGVLIRVVSNVVFFTWVALQTSTRLFDAEKKREGAEEERSNVMKALEQAVRARDELLSVCSHEMRTPLTSMKLANQLVERQIAKGDPRAFEPAQVTRTVKTSSAQINRLMKLIEEMLDFSRIAEGRLTIRPEPTELKSLLENVVGQVSPELNASKCDFTAAYVGEVHGQWDQFRIEQVIINLLGNSMKYGKGCPIHLTLSETPAMALITVKDEGCGVAEENLNRVFEPYVRAESTLHVTGLGLGLYISQQIVNGHGGRIWMESKPGHGTAVHVELPKQNQPVSG